jgi:hypothetical protein
MPANPTARELLDEIEKGLEGVTPGPWDVLHFAPDGYRFGHSFVVRQSDANPADKHHWPVNVCTQPAAVIRHEPNRDGDWIARCNPANLRTILAYVKELERALEFYANPEVYKPHPHGPAFDRRDLSFRALEVLPARSLGGSHVE